MGGGGGIDDKIYAKNCQRRPNHFSVELVFCLTLKPPLSSLSYLFIFLFNRKLLLREWLTLVFTFFMWNILFVPCQVYRIDKLFHIVWTTEWKIYFSKNSTKFEFFFSHQKVWWRKEKITNKTTQEFSCKVSI